MKKFISSLALTVLAALLISSSAYAHPMGNFSINHHSTLTISDSAIRVEHILDFAEIPTFQMFPDARSDSFAARIRSMAREWAGGLKLAAGSDPLVLELDDVNFTIVPGAAGLATVRVDMLLHSKWTGRPEMVHFVDNNFPDRIGWKEIVPPFGVDLSDKLNVYPTDLLSTAPNVVETSFRIDAISSEMRTQSQAAARPAPDQLSEILNSDVLPLRLVLFGALIAFALGALHALSPGHGKTVVAAYLVGNRGTARHALFLGSVVTFTHTAGVFILGFVTLFLSRYIVPEQLYPWVGFTSGLMILAIGVNLFHQRFGHLDHEHGPNGHSHALPEGISFRSLLALGFSGGILPCPSALVVLLSAIALHRIAIGLLFIVAFSAGLASVLVGVGILVVRTSRLLSGFNADHPAARFLPLLSAAIISIIGLGVAIESLTGAGIVGTTGSLALNGGALAVLALGLLLGLKHATDADHVVAVTTFLSQERSVLRGCWIGAFWGLGHTLSLAIAGLIVIGLKINIPDWLSARLEFCVAIMLVGLGARSLLRKHDNPAGIHSHAHGLRPLLVGAVHGAAGSAALMLLVLSTIQSPLEAFLYILIFGLGSILGMLAISFLLAVPLHWAQGKVGVSYRPIQVIAGVFSCVFGLFLGAQIWMTLP